MVSQRSSLYSILRTYVGTTACEYICRVLLCLREHVVGTLSTTLQVGTLSAKVKLTV